MKLILSHLKFFVRRLSLLALLMAVVLAPLGYIVSVWLEKNARRTLQASCEAATATLRSDLEQVFLNHQHTLQTRDTNATLPDDWVASITVTKNGFDSTKFNSSALSRLSLQPQQLMIALSQKSEELLLLKTSEKENVSALTLNGLKLWLVARPIKKSQQQPEYTYTVMYPSLINQALLSQTSCVMAILSPQGDVLSPDLNLAQQNLSKIFSIVQKNPLVQKNESLEVPTWGTVASHVIRGAFGSHIVGQTELKSSVQLKKQSLLQFFYLSLALYAGLVLILLPTWWQDLRVSRAMTRTLEDYVNNKFNSRPRLFLKDHFESLEKAVDAVGRGLQDVVKWGDVVRKNQIPIKELKNIPDTHKVMDVVYLTVVLHDTKDLAETSQQQVSIYNTVSEIFAVAVRANNGQIDNLHIDTLQAVWGLKPNELDTPNAAMAALQIKISIDQWNNKRQEKGEAPLLFGIGLHRAPAHYVFSGPKDLESLYWMGEPVTESKKLARLAMASRQDILATESVATLVEPYFVMTSVKTLPLTDLKYRVYLIEGYVDNQESPVLIKSKNRNS